MAETEYPKFDKNCCLKIDLDNMRFDMMLKIVSRRFHIIRKFGITFKQAFVFDTTKGQHLYLEFLNDEKWQALDFRDKIFLQLVMGSDMNREAFNWLRAKNDINWNILFIRKYDEKGELISEEKYNEESSKKFDQAYSKFLTTAKWLKK
jgi:glyoxylate utilization-related uncharacterized protein